MLRMIGGARMNHLHSAFQIFPFLLSSNNCENFGPLDFQNSWSSVQPNWCYLTWTPVLSSLGEVTCNNWRVLISADFRRLLAASSYELLLVKWVKWNISGDNTSHLPTTFYCGGVPPQVCHLHVKLTPYSVPFVFHVPFRFSEYLFSVFPGVVFSAFKMIAFSLCIKFLPSVILSLLDKFWPFELMSQLYLGLLQV